MGMGVNRNVPFPSSVAPIVFYGQMNRICQRPITFVNQCGSLSNKNLLGASGCRCELGLGDGRDCRSKTWRGMVDSRMLAAYQQAMMIAKLTNQLVVAQQAMRDAADE